MSDTKYTYAVARIRALELSLFSAATLDQLMACKGYEQCLQFLAEKGWGSTETPQNAEAILTCEREKMWQTMEELSVDMSLFDVLSYPKLFHNLKAAVKELCTEEKTPGIFYEDCDISGETMMELLRNKSYQDFPASMQAAAKEAYETLLHTRDGQLCDVIVDRACLDAICKAGQDAEEPIIQDYAESTVAVADIKIAARGAATGKTAEFLLRAMSPCASLSVEELVRAALGGTVSLSDYLQSMGYGEAGEALRQSPSAFERWCDDRIIETIQPQLLNPFSVGPLFAYVLARENEIKTVRIILSGKRNELPEESIRERIRKMYV
ncbi:MAG: V-type ATPase subunit [Oscillospiraceae bacterium]|nr:V-type ATPase subunit [Oscillospiraceae bacterium]